jgi:hypothetical protein
MTYTDDNVLRRRDRESLATVEAAFRTGPLAQLLPAATEVERRRGITRDEFDHEYRAKGRPVVLEGYAEDWPAVRTWSFDHLAERCGHVRVTVDSYNSRAARQMEFAGFVAMLKASTGTGAAPVYLQEWYYQTSCPELAADLPEMEIAQYDFRRDLYGDAAATNHQLWLGQQGGITRLHQDSYMVDVMHVQIVGEKLWYVMGPEAYLHDTDDGLRRLCESPDTQLMRLTLRPGDVLYLPAMWFHRIELRSDSIGLGRKCLDPANLRPHIRQRMTELLALALNPDEVKQTHPELFDVVMMRNRAWAKRMDIDLSKLRP